MAGCLEAVEDYGNIAFKNARDQFNSIREYFVYAF
jgi:hypothetical protein